MTLFTETDVRKRAQTEIKKTGMTKNSRQLVYESFSAYSHLKTYDIFLSHSIHDSELILGMKGIFEDLSYSVYVDWIEDPQLDRSNVTIDTAEKLRRRMSNSKSLFYVTTSNSELSKWMPWECGYFDGKKEKVAIVPIQTSSYSNYYSGQEYLGLYPYVVKETAKNQQDYLWIHKSYSQYITFDHWINTQNSQIPWAER